MEVIGKCLTLCVILKSGGASSAGGGFLLVSLMAPYWHPGNLTNVSCTLLLFVLVPYGLNGGSSSWIFGCGASTFLGGSSLSPIGPITTFGLLNVPK